MITRRTLLQTSLLAPLAALVLGKKETAEAQGPFLDPTRTTTWVPGMMAVGGIPSRTTVFTTIQASTYGNGTQEASAGIQSALNACPAGQVVQLSAGTFLCISLSDLLPELQFHHHDRGKLSAALVLGLLVAVAVAQMEAAVHGPHPHVNQPASTVPLGIDSLQPNPAANLNALGQS